MTRRLLPARLTALVFDADTRLIDGEPDQSVELDGPTWAAIVEAARREDRADRDDVLPTRSEIDELKELRAAQAKWIANDAAQARELMELREFKAKRIARNIDGSEYTFSTLAPEVEAFLGQNDGKGGERDCHVRFLLDDGAGCVIDFKKARDFAHETLSKIDAALFVPEKKQKKARGKKMFCGTCNAETKHDGNDECVVCANPEPEFEPIPPPRKPEQTELEQAISGVAS